MISNPPDAVVIRRRASLALPLVAVSLVICLAGLTWAILAQMRQDALNRALIEEIKKQSGATKAKTEALLNALARTDWPRVDEVAIRHRDPEGNRIYSGTADRVKRLLNEGASPNARDETSRVPLSFWDHLRVLLHLRKPNPGGGKPALALALDGRDPEIVKALVEQGANANVVGDARMTPLEWSSGWPDATLTLLLLKRGVNVKNREGANAVLIAAGDGNMAVLKALLDYGADVNARLRHADTPLTEAIEWRTQVPLGQALTTVKFLLDHHADVNIKGPQGDTPLSAARYGMKHPRDTTVPLNPVAQAHVVQSQDKRELTAIIRLLKQHGAKE